MTSKLASTLSFDDTYALQNVLAVLENMVEDKLRNSLAMAAQHSN